MTLQPINYKALNEPVKPLYRWLVLCVATVALSVALIIYMGVNNLYTSDSRQAATTGFYLLATIIIAIVFSCLFLYSYNRRHDRRLERFAKDNNWQRTKSDHELAIPGTVEELFDDVGVNFDINGTYEQSPIRLSLLGCEAKSLNVFINLICLKIDISKSMPLIVLLSKVDKMNLANILAARPNDEKILQLEGNFNSTYKLFVNESTERDVLEVLTPDVMEALINIVSPSSITLNGSELSLFLSADDFTENNLVRLFATANTVINELSLLQ